MGNKENKIRPGSKRIGARKVLGDTQSPDGTPVEEGVVVDAEPNAGPGPDDGQGTDHVAGIDQGMMEKGWNSYREVARAIVRITNPAGREVTILSELRVPEGKSFMKVAIGRKDTKSPIGMSRQCYYEDIPAMIDALIDIYDKGAEKYVQMETERLMQQLNQRTDQIEKTVSVKPEKWRARLQEIRSRIREDVG